MKQSNVIINNSNGSIVSDTLLSSRFLPDRREFLNAAAAALFGSNLFDNEKHSETQKTPPSPLYELRNLKEAYRRWHSQTEISTMPPYEKFVAAIEMCRQATCVIYSANGDQFQVVQSAFLIDIPVQYRTALSRDKIYIVTCDHSRANGAANLAHKFVLSNQINLSKNSYLIESLQQNNYPTKDLRIYEFPANTNIGNLTKIPLYPTDSEPKLNQPVIIYEPLALHSATLGLTSNGSVNRVISTGRKPQYEKFVLTRVTKSNAYAGENGILIDPNYPLNTAFMTAGQLMVGGSGSPALLYDDKKNSFYLAGFQTMHVPDSNHDRESVDGEIQVDGVIFDAKNIISLLMSHKRWKQQ